jgi:hypothetical protein
MGQHTSHMYGGNGDNNDEEEKFSPDENYLMQITHHQLDQQHPDMRPSEKEAIMRSAAAVRDMAAYRQQFGNNDVTRRNFRWLVQQLLLPDTVQLEESPEFIRIANQLFNRYAEIDNSAQPNESDIMTFNQLRAFSMAVRQTPLGFAYIPEVDFSGMETLVKPVGPDPTVADYVGVAKQMRFLHDIYDVQKFHNFIDPRDKSGGGIPIENAVWDTICRRNFLNRNLLQRDCEFVSLPVVDFSAPTPEQLNIFLTNIARCTGSAGHCASGDGRTGVYLMSALTLALGAENIAEAEAMIKQHYKHASYDEVNETRTYVEEAMSIDTQLQHALQQDPRIDDLKANIKALRSKKATRGIEQKIGLALAKIEEIREKTRAQLRAHPAPYTGLHQKWPEFIQWVHQVMADKSNAARGLRNAFDASNAARGLRGVRRDLETRAHGTKRQREGIEMERVEKRQKAIADAAAAAKMAADALIATNAANAANPIELGGGGGGGYATGAAYVGYTIW